MAQEEEEQGVETERNLLARHTVLAEFAGLEQGREPMLRIYPPQPAKIWAKFLVEEVQEYEKPGQYGEEQLPPRGEKAFERDSQPQAIQQLLAALVPGDRVRLGWNHDYVTHEFTSPDGRKSTSQFPEHTITTLERVSGGVPTTAAQPAAYVAAPMAVPMAAVEPERYSVTPETFAKLAAGGALSQQDLAQLSPASPKAAAVAAAGATSPIAGPILSTAATAGASSPAQVTSAPSSPGAGGSSSTKKSSKKKTSLKVSKKKKSSACC